MRLQGPTADHYITSLEEQSGTRASQEASGFHVRSYFTWREDDACLGKIAGAVRMVRDGGGRGSGFCEGE